jgi:hypothetical protein
MKPIVIIAIAVVCSVVAVLVVFFAIGEYQIWKYNEHLEYLEKLEAKQQLEQRDFCKQYFPSSYGYNYENYMLCLDSDLEDVLESMFDECSSSELVEIYGMEARETCFLETYKIMEKWGIEVHPCKRCENMDCYFQCNP